MAFDDLDDAASEQQQAGDERAADIQEPSTAPPAVEDQNEPTDASDTNTETPATDGQQDPLTDPAFEFSESTQAQIYPRESTFEEFEDTLDIDVKRLLRERGIRNEAGRELHEALLRVAIENPDLVAEKVEQERQS